MKGTMNDLLELQKLWRENKEKWEEEGVIEGQGGRQDGYLAEELVHILTSWERNNTVTKTAPDFRLEGYGLADLKLGAAKQYGDDTFLLEVIQNPSRGMSGLSSWTYTGSVDYLLYLDMSDDTFPIYFYSVPELIKHFGIHNLINNLKESNFSFYNNMWRKNSILVPPRSCDESVKGLSCFGKRALGYKLPVSLAKGKINLIDYIFKGEEDGSTTTSASRISRTDKKQTSSNLRNSKK